MSDITLTSSDLSTSAAGRAYNTQRNAPTAGDDVEETIVDNDNLLLPAQGGTDDIMITIAAHAQRFKLTTQGITDGNGSDGQSAIIDFGEDRLVLNNAIENQVLEFERERYAPNYWYLMITDGDGYKVKGQRFQIPATVPGAAFNSDNNPARVFQGAPSA